MKVASIQQKAGCGGLIQNLHNTEKKRIFRLGVIVRGHKIAAGTALHFIFSKDLKIKITMASLLPVIWLDLAPNCKDGI